MSPIMPPSAVAEGLAPRGMPPIGSSPVIVPLQDESTTSSTMDRQSAGFDRVLKVGPKRLPPADKDGCSSPGNEFRFITATTSQTLPLDSARDNSTSSCCEECFYCPECSDNSDCRSCLDHESCLDCIECEDCEECTVNMPTQERGFFGEETPGDTWFDWDAYEEKPRSFAVPQEGVDTLFSAMNEAGSFGSDFLVPQPYAGAAQYADPGYISPDDIVDDLEVDLYPVDSDLSASFAGIGEQFAGFPMTYGEPTYDSTSAAPDLDGQFMSPMDMELPVEWANADDALERPAIPPPQPGYGDTTQDPMVLLYALAQPAADANAYSFGDAGLIAQAIPTYAPLHASPGLLPTFDNRPYGYDQGPTLYLPAPAAAAVQAYPAPTLATAALPAIAALTAATPTARTTHKPRAATKGGPKKRCPICHKGPFDASGLARHRKSKGCQRAAGRTPEDKYQCPYCPMTQPRQDHIKRHIRKRLPRSKPEQSPGCKALADLDARGEIAWEFDVNPKTGQYRSESGACYKIPCTYKQHMLDTYGGRHGQ